MPSKLNFIGKLQHWMDSVPGQTFLNYAYSWGASIIILGALFKLTHLPGANLMLFIGMGTEAFVFFLSAFDRPFDKNEIGKPLARDFETEAEMMVADEAEATSYGAADATESAATVMVAADATNDTDKALAQVSETEAETLETNGAADSDTTQHAETNRHTAKADGAAERFVTQHFDSPEGERIVEAEAEKLASIIRLANDELLRRTQAVLAPDMEAATQEYIDKLRTLNNTLALVDEQSARLTRDSQEMENLNRTLVGINKVYDLHFASISRQVSTIEDINRQTQELAEKIEEVNQIYSRMVQTLAFMGQPVGLATQGAKVADHNSTTNAPHNGHSTTADPTDNSAS